MITSSRLPHLRRSLMPLALALAACGPAEDGGSSAPPAPAPSPASATFYLSGHGASASGDPSANTVFGLDASGALVGSVLSAQDPLDEPRGMLLLDDGSLLVAASWKGNTHIARFGAAGPDGVRQLAGVFASQGEANPAMVHTYAIAQAPDGSIYASNQDTCTVTRYAGPASSAPGTPLPLPPSVQGIANAPPGLFAPSSKMVEGGLEDVRGIVFGPDGKLYVADRGAARVVVYDPASGQMLRVVAERKHGFEHPIQVRFGKDPDEMFVSDNGVNGVLRVKLSSGKVETLISKQHGDLSEPGALLIEGDDLYVGDRKTRTILHYRLPKGERLPQPLTTNLPSPPEFLIRARR